MLRSDLPKPFKNSTQLHFAVPAIKNDASLKRKVFIAVYDLHGRLVRTLVNGFVPVGYHQITFDATDNSSKAFGSGVFFCRMQAEGFVKSIKIVLSR
jgi:flagellar hook assembly protein FlgD